MDPIKTNIPPTQTPSSSPTTSPKNESSFLSTLDKVCTNVKEWFSSIGKSPQDLKAHQANQTLVEFAKTNPEQKRIATIGGQSQEITLYTTPISHEGRIYQNKLKNGDFHCRHPRILTPLHRTCLQQGPASRPANA